MDRSWLHGTLFSDESVSGVKESMDFIKENFSDNDDSGGDDRVEGILRDLQSAEEQGRPDGENPDGNNDDGNLMDKDSFLDNVMKEAKHQLYPGCSKF